MTSSKVVMLVAEGRMRRGVVGLAILCCAKAARQSSASAQRLNDLFLLDASCGKKNNIQHRAVGERTALDAAGLILHISRAVISNRGRRHPWTELCLLSSLSYCWEESKKTL